MSVFFSADYHFGHTNIIRFCNRPFKNVHYMNELLINNWNKVVPVDGTTYHIGDFAFGAPGWIKQVIERLNGDIIFIRGSHDKGIMKLYGNLPYMKEVNINGQLIMLSHYAMRTWPKSHYNTWHLFGHSHNKLHGQGKSFDVGVDTWHLKTHTPFSPYSFDEVKTIMDLRPDNFNCVGKKHGRMNETKET